jgi:hypothetical protein
MYVYRRTTHQPKHRKGETIMVDFDKLNRETKEFNNRNVDRFNSSTPNAYGTSTYWQNYWNNQTYKQNNGQYSKKYF